MGLDRTETDQRAGNEGSIVQPEEGCTQESSQQRFSMAVDDRDPHRRKGDRQENAVSADDLASRQPANEEARDLPDDEGIPVRQQPERQDQEQIDRWVRPRKISGGAADALLQLLQQGWIVNRCGTSFGGEVGWYPKTDEIS